MFMAGDAALVAVPRGAHAAEQQAAALTVAGVCAVLARPPVER
ncbi:hypothetical protein [Nocardia albiluteola]|nr:hypothetical protein [Nocardia albiluteola]